MKICPNCHSKFDDNQEYCTKCGTPLFQKSSKSQQQETQQLVPKKSVSREMICPVCGKHYTSGQKYCTQDGARLISAQNEKGADDPIPFAEEKQRTSDDVEVFSHAKKKKNNSSVPIIIGALAGAACACALLVHAGIIRLPSRRSDSASANIAENQNVDSQNNISDGTQSDNTQSDETQSDQTGKTENTLTDDTSVHTYRIVAADVTWEEAFQDAIQDGGYLARINSEEEFQTIVNQLNNEGAANMHYYLGGQRDSNNVYHWINTNYQFFSEDLTGGDYWASKHWYAGEPSLTDTGTDANGRTIDENCMGLTCVDGTWYLNDTTDDLVGNYPDWLTGKVGYIIEYPY